MTPLLLLLAACQHAAAPPADSAAPDDTAPSDTALDYALPEGPFHPQLSGYPRIVARPEDREAVLARATGAVEGADPEVAAAWAWLAARQASGCASSAPELPADPINAGATYSAMIVARSCAFQAWLNQDAAAAARAEAILLTLPPDAHALGDATLDVHLSTALALAVQSWDLLAGSGLMADPDAAAAPVLALADSMFQRYVRDEPFWYLLWQNNHNLKFAGALGQAAIVFNTDDRAWTWAAYALTEIDWLLDLLSTPDGGYAEGTYYQTYAAFQVLPLLRAWHRLLGDTGEPLPVTCATRPDCEEDTWVFPGDLWTDPRLLAGADWSRRVRMPDGDRAPIDDSRPEGFPSALLAERDPALGWDWLSQQDPMVSLAGDISAEILAAWDGTAEEPDESPCQSLPESGVGVAADGRALDATWAMLLAEPGGATYGGGHEHADVGSVTVFAGGQSLVIDPGYAGWDSREYTAEAEDHSGVLVNREGPPSSAGAGLSVDWSDTAPCAPLARIGWDGVDWQRGLALEGDAVVVRDALRAPSSADFTWRWHLLTGDGRGSFEPRDWGGVLRRDGVSLTLAVTGPVAPALGLEAADDGLSYGELRSHDVLTADLSGAQEAALLTVMVVGEEDAEPSVVVGDDAVTIDGVTYTR